MDGVRIMQRRTNRRKADFTSAGIGQDDDPAEVLLKVKEIFLNCSVHWAPRKVHACNALVRIAKRIRAKIDTDELFFRLLPAFFQDSREVRSASLRCVRKYLTDQAGADSFFKFHIDLCVAKCLDLGCLDDEAHLAPLFQSERFQAVKLIRQLMRVGAGRVPASLVQPLLAICRHSDREDRRDPLMKASIYLLAELGALSPSQLAGSGALKTVLQAVLDDSLPPRCTEVLVGVLANLLNRPDTRRYLQPLPESLHCLLSPLTNPSSCRSCDSRQALLSLFRTWPGLLSLSPRSLVAMLFVNSEDARSALVDFFFDLFLVPKPPPDVADFAEAIQCLDPPSESWDLTEGFVAAEGGDLLEYRCPTRLNLLDNHLAFLLHLFVHCGLAHGLASLLADKGSDQLAIRCALLLGELTHRSRLLPAALRAIGSALSSPALLRNQRALIWLAGVQRAREKPPRPRNILLVTLVAQAKPAPPLVAPLLSAAASAAAASAAMAPEDQDDWAWPELLGLVRCLHADTVAAVTTAASAAWASAGSGPAAPPASPTAFTFAFTAPPMIVANAELHDAVRRLCAFYTPPPAIAPGAPAPQVTGPATFLTRPLSWRHSTDAFLIGVELMRMLSRLPDSTELSRCLVALLADLCGHLRNRLMQTPSLLVGSCARYATGLLGALTSSERGEELLEGCNAKQLMLDMVSPELGHIYLAKLALVSVDYNRSHGFGRLLLCKALSCGDEECRVYATRLMTVMLRADLPFFANWGVELLVKQLYDTQTSVCLAALTALEEACEMEVNKNVLVRLRPAALHLGDQGAVLIAKLCGFSLGFRVLRESNWLQQHFDMWSAKLCDRYPLLVEQLLTDALTGYEMPPPGQEFVRASSRPKAVPKRVLLPAHLFGQLAMHKEGFDFLRGQACVRQAIEHLFQLVQPGGQQRWDSQAEIVSAKSAVWSLGHIGSTTWGLALIEQDRVAPALALLAECCPVLSVRGACFYAMCLLAATERGCAMLSEIGWDPLRSNRSQLYPVVLSRQDQHQQQYQAQAAFVLPPGTVLAGDSWRMSQDSVNGGAGGGCGGGSRASSVSTADSAMGRQHSLSVTSCQWHTPAMHQQTQQFNLAAAVTAATAECDQSHGHRHSQQLRKARSVSASASEYNAAAAAAASIAQQQQAAHAPDPDPVVAVATGLSHLEEAPPASGLPSATSTWTGGSGAGARARLAAASAAASASASAAAAAASAFAASPSMGALDAAGASSGSSLSGSGGGGGGGGGSHQMSAALVRRFGAPAGVLYQCLALPVDPLRVTLCAGCCSGGDGTAAAAATAAAATAASPTESGAGGSEANNCCADDQATGASGPTSGYASRCGSKPQLVMGSDASASASLGGSGGWDTGLDLHSEETCIGCAVQMHKGLPAIPLAQILPDQQLPTSELVLVRRETVRLVCQLACHVNQSRNELALIQLKARLPAAFSQDMCLYSEVALALARHPYSRRSRAFVQELFADSVFDMLFTVTAQASW